ncbi:MAG: hypothetical protein H0V82_04460 [Candidatus Protochlamydia sp.]|nr:hypothetical protein [Candidatus Protochlamydia sp.]
MKLGTPLLQRLERCVNCVQENGQELKVIFDKWYNILRFRIHSYVELSPCPALALPMHFYFHSPSPYTLSPVESN